MNMKFGENFKELRKQKDLTQESIAEILGVTSQSVSRWELGMCYPDIELLPTIAEYFDVSIDSLLADKESSEKSARDKFTKQFYMYNSGSLEQVEFAKDYHIRHPKADYAAMYYAAAIVNSILNKQGVLDDYWSTLIKLADRLLETEYRYQIIRWMIIVCGEDKLSEWLEFLPFSTDISRRGCLLVRYNARHDGKNSYIQKGLEALENFAMQLDRRDPEVNGPKRKAEYHKEILSVLEAFGKDGQIPDGWIGFYAYKQLVLSACLFGAGENDEGWSEFKAAIEKYRYTLTLKDNYLSVGGELFSNLKVSRDWKEAIDEDGRKHKLFDVEWMSNNNEDLYECLTNPAWTWFDSVRNTPEFVAAVEWAKSKMNT